jgi:hypothetical protein
MNPDELLMGALPFVNYSAPQSTTISTGGAGMATGGGGPAVSLGAQVEAGTGGGGAVAQVNAATGGAVLITWVVLIVILIAANVFTLRIQR